MANAIAARAWFLSQGIARPTSPNTSRPRRRTSRPRRSSPSPPPRLLGIGGRALLAVERDRPADRPGHRRAIPPVSKARYDDRHFAEAPLSCNLRCSWVCSTFGIATSTASPAASSAVPPGPGAIAGYLQQLEMETTASASPWRASRAVCHQPGGLGRARHQRPARLLPDAAPGHGRGAGGVHRRAHASAAWPTSTPSCSPTVWRKARR